MQSVTPSEVLAFFLMHGGGALLYLEEHPKNGDILTENIASTISCFKASEVEFHLKREEAGADTLET
jgi:hypothetical protein